MEDTIRNLLLAGALLAAPTAVPGADLRTVNRITDAAFNHGEVVETAAYLADRIGGRLPNSPAMRTAERWTQNKFREWGLTNVHAEGFDFGRGWWMESSRVRMTVPRALEVRAVPIAWTVSTSRPIRAPIVVAPMASERDFAAWKGKLQGKVILVSYPEPPKDATDPLFSRFSETELARLDVYEPPVNDPSAEDRTIRHDLFPAKLDAFLKSEGALAWVRMSRLDGRLVHGDSYTESFMRGRTPALPAMEFAAEDYRRLARLAKQGPVEIEMESRVHFEDADPKAYNILAEIAGGDPKAGYVMAGAHLDSWVAGDGAADDGAGCAIVMEAARILASLHVKPRRTIRFALWNGEEEGWLGSLAYIERHLAKRPNPTNPEKSARGAWLWMDNAYPVTPLPGYHELAGYFNVDYGSGKIRGIYAENNLAAVPLLKEWLAPFASMGASTVATKPTGGTDHIYMSRIGLPAFQFIQDPLDYFTRVHHTDIDTFDHLRTNDLRQAAAILASVLLAAAESDTPLPPGPLPQKPGPSDPFFYPKPVDDE